MGDGERKEYREGKERMTRQLVNAGYKPDVAEQMARDSVRRVEASRSDKGLGPPRQAS